MEEIFWSLNVENSLLVCRFAKRQLVVKSTMRKRVVKLTMS